MHVSQRMHSVDSTRRPALTYSGMRMSIGHCFAHAPQSVHASALPRILSRENRDVSFSSAVIGQTYLQKARLSRSVTASAMPTP